MNAPSPDVQRLGEFIAAAKAKGLDDAFVVTLLRQRGFSERRAYAAFAAYYERELGMPVPSRGGSAENARDAFLYLLAFATLVIWAVALIWLGDALADRAFPSALDYADVYDNFRESVAGQLASIIVAFPIYLFVNAAIVKQTRLRPESFDSGVRKWLTYIALVVTAVCLVGDGVWFLREFLVGDLTARLVAKVLVLLVVAGGIFWYYLASVRGHDAPANERGFPIAAIAFVGASIVFGFAGIGSPGFQRQVAMDRRRVDDLRSLESAITGYYSVKRVLPPNLNAVSNRLYTSTIYEPGTTVPYEYIPGIGSRYRLCATFETARPVTMHDGLWGHGVGRTCFSLDASR